MEELINFANTLLCLDKGYDDGHDDPYWQFRIKKVIFSNPATIVMWKDGTKTVVKCKNEDYDKEKGLAMCFVKKALGNRYDYYDYFSKHVED